MVEHHNVPGLIGGFPGCVSINPGTKENIFDPDGVYDYDKTTGRQYRLNINGALGWTNILKTTIVVGIEWVKSRH